MNKPLKIGFNTFDTCVRAETPGYVLPLENGVDFVFCHFDPDMNGAPGDLERAKETAKCFKSRQLPFIANFEFQNFQRFTQAKDGYDWANRPDGTHLLKFRPGYIEALASEGNLIGVTYDEFEHVILNRNVSIFMDSKGKVDLPAFPPLDTADAFRQGEYLAAQLKDYADAVKAAGAPVFGGEHVFPVLYHHFARSGMIPNFKSQKEAFSNLQFAVAAGAALEYGTPLWNCVDLWHKLTFPGHTPEEMYHNLLFAYLAGVNRVYVEASNAFITDDAMNDYGEAFLRFTKEFKGKERPYDIADYRPEIGIIRYDDTFWGQNLIWYRGLFGNKKIRAGKESREWITAVRTITRNETDRSSFTWNRIDPVSLLPHRSFCTMNGLAVFDDRVKKETLASLKLCFLCGVRISPETLAAVDALVEETGLTVVCPKRYAPAKYRDRIGGAFTEISAGKGCYLVTDDFASTRLKARIDSFLGNEGEIRLRFGDETVRLAVDDKGETFSVL